MLQFFSLISDGLGGVECLLENFHNKVYYAILRIQKSKSRFCVSKNYTDFAIFSIFNYFSKDGFKGNDSLISWMLIPLGCVFCVKNDNKNCLLDNLSQSFSDIFHNSFIWQKMAKSIVNIAPDINEYLRNVFTIQTIQHTVYRISANSFRPWIISSLE